MPHPDQLFGITYRQVNNDDIAGSINLVIRQSVYYVQLFDALDRQLKQYGISMGVDAMDRVHILTDDGTKREKFHSINEAVTYAFELLADRMKADSE